MSLAAFQRAITRMTLEVPLARAVRELGSEALRDFDLTPIERRRLVAVSRQPGMALNCTLARANRFAGIHDAFPMTCVLLGPALRPVLDAVWAVPPDGYQLAGDVDRFAAAVLDHPAARALACPYLREVVTCESTARELVLSARHVPDVQGWRSPSRWLPFDHDPGALFAALGAFRRPEPPLPAIPHRVRLRVVDGALETTGFRIIDDEPMR